MSVGAQTYYEILGVKVDSPESEIYRAFIDQAVQVHPDIVNADITAEYQQERFEKLVLAWACLGDAYLRQKYNELSVSLQKENAARKSTFLRGAERDITENEACLIWETACLEHGSVPNKILREYSLKSKDKSTRTVVDEDDEFEDVTHTPDKHASSSSASDNKKATIETMVKPEKPLLTIKDLINAVKYGMRTDITRQLFHYPEHVNEFDEQGYTAAHWAAKSGNVYILQTLFVNGAKLNLLSKSQHPMTPLHWAASDGKLATTRFLLDNNVSINVQDSSGCTPVVIAAQHDQRTCVAFLVKNGADMTLGDNNGDTAVHWSAYKGFSELTGLLAYTCPGAINATDTYGQTPLHLAALRGHVDTVEYLVMDCKADMTIKDKNGLTPLELSVKKEQFNAEWALRSMSTSSKLELAQSLTLKRLTEGRVVKNLFLGANNRENSVWPWRIVFVSNFIGTCYSLYFTFHEQMADYWLLHMINTALQSCWWFCFWMCIQKNTAYVIDPPSQPGSETSLYEEALKRVGQMTTDLVDLVPNFCHTCHVIRPLRSKHCQIQRCCINKFDHFCPFVYNTVSRDNYKYFLGVVCLHVLLSTFWEITALVLWQRADISWNLTLFMGYLVMWVLALAGLVHYHMTLIQKNMTTNEDMNVQRGKYSHFMDEQHRFDNPFDLGDAKKNVMDGLFPNTIQLYNREEAKDLQRRLLSGSEGSDRESLLAPKIES